MLPILVNSSNIITIKISAGLLVDIYKSILKLVGKCTWSWIIKAILPKNKGGWLILPISWLTIQIFYPICSGFLFILFSFKNSCLGISPPSGMWFKNIFYKLWLDFPSFTSIFEEHKSSIFMKSSLAVYSFIANGLVISLRSLCNLKSQYLSLHFLLEVLKF